MPRSRPARDRALTRSPRSASAPPDPRTTTSMAPTSGPAGWSEAPRPPRRPP